MPILRGCTCRRYPGGYRYVGRTPPDWWACVRCDGLWHRLPPRFEVRLTGGMVGKTYLEKGEPVTVLAQWRGAGCPRNVVVADAKGRTKVRPARGLRLPSGNAHQGR